LRATRRCGPHPPCLESALRLPVSMASESKSGGGGGGGGGGGIKSYVVVAIDFGTFASGVAVGFRRDGVAEDATTREFVADLGSGAGHKSRTAVLLSKDGAIVVRTR
jgi:hypothetical protein